MQKLRDNTKTLLLFENEAVRQLSEGLTSKGIEVNSKTLQVQLSSKGFLCFGIGTSYAIRVSCPVVKENETQLRISAHLLKQKQTRNWVGLASLVENNSVVIAENCVDLRTALAFVLSHAQGKAPVFGGPELSCVMGTDRLLDSAMDLNARSIAALAGMRNAGLISDVAVLDKITNHVSAVVSGIGLTCVEIFHRYKNTKRKVQAGTRINKAPRRKKQIETVVKETCCA